jgi:hypothetical protein
MIQYYGGDIEEQINTQTLSVFLLSIAMVSIPFTLRDTEAGNSSSILFISLPPDGNQTMANNALITGMKPGVVVFEFNNYTWAHILCATAGIEVLLLWVKLCKIETNTPFTQAKVLNIGGLYTANNEFWVFVGLHHAIFIMLLISPISLHSLVLFVWCIVATFSKICEPGEEHDDDSPRSEIYFNRIAAVFCYTLLSGVLFVVDTRMNRQIIGDVAALNTDLIFIQFVIDTLLVIAHVSVQVEITTCYYVRLSYTFTCWGLVVYFLAWGTV